MFGVPVIIPLAWAMMAYPALLAARRLSTGALTTPLVGAVALASWDLFLDPMMTGEGYWRFSHTSPALPHVPAIPVSNYLGWLLAAFAMMLLLDRLPRRHGARRSPCAALSVDVRLVRGRQRLLLRPTVGGALRRDRDGSRRCAVHVGAVVRARLIHRLLRGATYVGSTAAVAGTVHLAANLRLVRRPRMNVEPIVERVSVLLPVRDEAARVAPCLRVTAGAGSVAGSGDPGPRRRIDGRHSGPRHGSWSGGDRRVRLIQGSPLPAGWLGKPHACAQLAQEATGDVLVFVDADVVLAPGAVAATVALLRESDLQLVSPYPRQLADGLVPRLVQPLLQWSWLTFLPLRLAETSARPSLVAANGQLMAVDAAAYRAARGHAGRTVRAAVLEDIELMKSLEAAGLPGRRRRRDSPRRLPDVLPPAPSCATATPSRCGPRSARRPVPPPSASPSSARTSFRRAPRCSPTTAGPAWWGSSERWRQSPGVPSQDGGPAAACGRMPSDTRCRCSRSSHSWRTRLRRHRNGSLTWKGRQV